MAFLVLECSWPPGYHCFRTPSHEQNLISTVYIHSLCPNESIRAQLDGVGLHTSSLWHEMWCRPGYLHGTEKDLQMMLVSTRYDIRIYFITRSARLILSSDEAELTRKPNASFWSCWDQPWKTFVRPRDDFSMRKNLLLFHLKAKHIKTNKNSRQISSFIESQATFGIFPRWIFPVFFLKRRRPGWVKTGGRRDVFDRGRCHWNLSFWAYSRDFVTYLKKFLVTWKLHTKNPWVFGKRLFIIFWFCWCIYVR